MYVNAETYARITEREIHQLPFYCYPPAVTGIEFERAARGLSPHPAEGERGALEEFAILSARRAKTQGQDTMI